MKIAVSDATGRYSIPSLSLNFNPFIHERRMGVEGVYKRGYTVVERRGSKREIVVMEPAVSVNQLSQAKLPMDCPVEVAAPLLPILREQHREMLELAESDADFERAANKLLPIEHIVSGTNQAHILQEEQERALRARQSKNSRSRDSSGAKPEAGSQK